MPESLTADQLQRRMAELTRRRNEDMALRGELVTARRPVPFELGDSLVPAVQWLLARIDDLRAQVAERDAQIAGLLADAPTDDYDELAVPQ